MHVIIVSDIFGFTPSLKRLQSALQEEGVSCVIVTPYPQAHTFESEGDAYASYVQLCGHNQYKEIITQALERVHEDTVCIGFSAGASAAWKALADDELTNTNGITYTRLNLKLIKHFIGFYPSKIRDYVSLVPHCPVSLIFPQHETHFDVDEVMDALPCSQGFTYNKTKMLHGFMNPQSQHYVPQASHDIGRILKQPKLIVAPKDFRQAMQRFTSL